MTGGKDKGLRGTLLDEHHPGMSVKVEGVRLKKNEGKDPATGQSVIQYAEDWIGYNDVKLIDPRLDAAVDIEFMELEDPITGEVMRTRVSRATGTVIAYPESKGMQPQVHPHTHTHTHTHTQNRRKTAATMQVTARRTPHSMSHRPAPCLTVCRHHPPFSS